MEADGSEPFGIDFVEFEYCYAADGFSPGFSANQITENYTWQRIGLRWVSPSSRWHLLRPNLKLFLANSLGHHFHNVLLVRFVDKNSRKVDM